MTARSARHATSDRRIIDESYVKVAGRWPYLYRDDRAAAVLLR